MATTPVFVRAPSGQAGLVLKIVALPSVGDLDPTAANGAGDTLTELTNCGGWYKADVTEALDGSYIGCVELSGNPIASFYLRMADTTKPVFESSEVDLSLDRGEPGQIVAPEFATPLEKIDWLYKYLINRVDQDGTNSLLYNYAATVVDNKRAVSDTGVGGYTSRENLISGP